MISLNKSSRISNLLTLAKLIRISASDMAPVYLMLIVLFLGILISELFRSQSDKFKAVFHVLV